MSRLFTLLLVMLIPTGLGCPTKPISVPPTPPPTSTLDSENAVEASAADGVSDSGDQPAMETDSESESLTAADAKGAASTPTFSPAGEWTTRKMVALVATGPLTIDLSVRMGGKSLEQASADATETVIAELKQAAKSDEALKWESVLDMELVQSGWIGNLIPDDEEQRGELVTMYDSNTDGLADDVELVAFLTRGLSRSASLQVTNGAGFGSSTGVSPWGPADVDQNNALDLSAGGEDGMDGGQTVGESEASEGGNFLQSIMQRDLNGDEMISRQEAVGEADMTGAMMGSRSLLDNTTLLVLEAQPVPANDNTSVAGESESAAAEEKQLRRKATELVKHYTILGNIPRDQFSNWDDPTWDRWDADHNLSLEVNEVVAMLQGEAAVSIYVDLPALAIEPRVVEAGDQRASQVIHVLSPAGDGTSSSWLANELAGNGAGGRFRSADCSVRIEVSDDLPAAAIGRLRAGLQQSLNNPQMKVLTRSQLGLSETGLDLIDSNRDGALSDEEFSRGMRWLAVRQEGRLLATWRVAGPAWFELSDANGDGRVTAPELRDLRARLAIYDRDGDGSITPFELPLLAALEVRRSDSRLSGLVPAGEGRPSTDVADPGDWFAAMDSNGDGAVSYAEFLGTREQFEKFDTDKDGFMLRREVYAAP